jgi:hypothetical protein
MEDLIADSLADSLAAGRRRLLRTASPMVHDSGESGETARSDVATVARA